MRKETQKQIEKVLQKQKKLAMLAVDPIKRAQIYGAWAGFLGGMRLSGVITNSEYQKLYNDMVNSNDTKRLA